MISCTDLSFVCRVGFGAHPLVAIVVVIDPLIFPSTAESFTTCYEH